MVAVRSSALPSERVAGYRLVRRLGKGGFGEVWLGEHGLNEGRAAIKRLRRPRPNARRMLRHEGQILARLDHPHIVPIFEVGADYLVTGFVDGISLAQRLGAPVPLDEVLRIACEVGDALQYAHDRDVIHCDVKPSNVLLDDRGTSYLADFGLARYFADRDATRVSGTPLYMAPEQRVGIATPAVDQYALARTVTEMLLATPPPADIDEANAALMPPHWTSNATGAATANTTLGRIKTLRMIQLFCSLNTTFCLTHVVTGLFS